MRFLELKIPPLIVVLVFGAFMWLLSRTLPNFLFSFPAQEVVGWFLYAAGASCAALGVYQFKKSQTTVDPRFPDKASCLVCDGIYRYSRNPMYLGFLLFLIGWGIQLSHSLAFLFIPLFILYMTRFQIIPEERFIYSKFGQAYQAYRAKVRRWI